MDYAMEYALMSDIYDDSMSNERIEPAEEGLFGIDNFIEKAIKWVLRLIRRLGNFLAKKSKLKSISLEDSRMEGHALGYVTHINYDIMFLSSELDRYDLKYPRINGNICWASPKVNVEKISRLSDNLDELFNSFARNYTYYEKAKSGDESHSTTLNTYWNSLVIKNISSNGIEKLKKSCEALSNRMEYYRKDFGSDPQFYNKDHYKKVVQPYINDCIKVVQYVCKYIATLENGRNS